MAERPTPVMNIIRRKTFQEATKGNRTTINDIDDELQDVLCVTDSVRESVIHKMNSVMGQATASLIDIAVKFWVHAAPHSETNPHTQNVHLDTDTVLDTAVDETMTEEIGESFTKESCTMWLDIITDERKHIMRQKSRSSYGTGLDYASAREISTNLPKGEGQYSALGGAYVRFIPQSLTFEQRKELDVLTDSWDAFLSLYNILTLKYKGLLQENGSAKIPGAPTLIGKSDTGDPIWDDLMDTNKVRNATLRYIMRNLRLFRKYYDTTGMKRVPALKGPASKHLADTVVNTALRGVVKSKDTEPIASVIRNVPKRIFWMVPKSSQNLEFQGIVPTFYIDPYTDKFRIRMNVLDATFSLEAALKTGICWSQFSGAFDYTVRLRKYTVNTGVLKFVFGINPAWIEQGRNFLNETMQDGTNVEVATEDVPW